jgi:hypothetical protein
MRLGGCGFLLLASLAACDPQVVDAVESPPSGGAGGTTAAGTGGDAASGMGGAGTAGGGGLRARTWTTPTVTASPTAWMPAPTSR